ncbi:hypothetical protein C0989_003435 [Termitomyces sp. Mn162]|nr:hypothetical protein C0989_003435 [Termitomyces sp. Mn162]
MLRPLHSGHFISRLDISPSRRKAKLHSMKDKSEFSPTQAAPSTKQSPTVASVSEEFVKEAIDNAQDAFQSGVWSTAPAIHRSKVLTKLARLLEDRISELAVIETLQTGRTIREMNAQLSRLPEWL